jgi:predicted transcriptional regulator
MTVMREILTISVDKALKNKIERVAKRLKVSKSELVKKAIEKYIVREEFRELRAMLIPYAEKAGYLTDEDVFKDYS